MSKRYNPSGFGKYTREQHIEKIRNGQRWKEELRLRDLERIKKGEENAKANQ